MFSETIFDAQELHEILTAIFSKLPVSVIEDGCRTFEENGMDEYVSYASCFVAMMCGEELFSTAPAIDKFAKYVTPDDLLMLSVTHYKHLEIVFLTACEFIS